MGVHIRELPAPPDVKENEANAAERVERFLRERNKRLSKDQMDRVEKHVGKLLKAARREYDPLRSRLSRYSDLLEGMVEETNFPFEGASNVTLRAAMGYARTFDAAFGKTTYSDPDLFYPVFDPGAEQELGLDDAKITALTEGFNHSFHTGCNGLDELRKGTIPAWRDATYLIEGSWERRVERVNDQRTYRDVQSFIKDYPDAAAAGRSEEDYTALLDIFLTEEEPEIIARFSYQHVQYDGAEYRQVLRAKFLVYPTTVRRLDRVQLYGCLFELTKAEIKERQRRGEFYEKQADKLMAKSAPMSVDAWDSRRMLIEGRQAPKDDAIPFKFADVVFKMDLDEDDVPEQYCGKFGLEGDRAVLVALRPYDVRHNVPSIVPFRLQGRDHAFDGISFVYDGQDLFESIDTLFRHDHNVMILTTSPQYMADANLKDQIDLGRADQITRPGVTYWIPSFNPAKPPIMQLQVADVAAASGDNNLKLSILSRFCEMLLGISQGESGNQTPDDPRAPAHKTQLLLLQANRRIDRCIDEWCSSLPDLAKLHAFLLYQYSPNQQYTFVSKSAPPAQGMGMSQGQGQPQVRSFDIALLASPKIKWVGKRRSVTLTPEFAIARLQSLMGTYVQLRPLLMQGDAVAIEIWNRTVKASGEPQAERFMISAEQAPMLAQKAIEMALRQHTLQANLRAQAKGKETLAKEAAKHAVKFLSDAATGNVSGAKEAESAAKPVPSLNGGNP